MGKIKESLAKSPEQRPKSVKQCYYRKVYDQLDDEDMNAINDAIAAGKGSYIIANALRDGGFKIVHSTVSLHLKGRCKCE